MKKLLISTLCGFAIALASLCTAQANLLLNGGFEDPLGGSQGWDAPGWVTKFDGTYWIWSDIDKAPANVFEGSHSARRVLFSGQPAGSTITLTGAIYQGVTPGETYHLELTTRTAGQAGKLTVTGIISFFDASKNLISSFQTESMQPTVWTQLAVNAIAPDNATSFQVTTVISMGQVLNGTAYVDLDSYSVTIIPETSATTLLGSVGVLGVLAGAARHRLKVRLSQ